MHALFKLLVVLVAASLFFPAVSPGETMTREQIVAEAEKTADAQLVGLGQEHGKKLISWVPAVMWAGLADFSHVSQKPAYTDALMKMGAEVNWTPAELKNRTFHADDICIGQAFLDVYETRKDPAMLAPTQARVGAVSDHLSQEKELTWWWCDSLMMAPPVLARLSTITQDPKYRNAMDQEWWRTADLLYDKEEHLFFRDRHFLNAHTKNGSKVFWARGNGWVFAGLARTLPYVPADDPVRAKYVTVFKDMAAKLASLQQTDGAWHPSLLDAEEFPCSESSGTALNCYAFAWGINNGLLDSKTYLPVVTKAWAALLAARLPDGNLGYVQGVGDRPGMTGANGTKPYAVGAFLMAACELIKLAPLHLPPPPQLKAKS